MFPCSHLAGEVRRCTGSESGEAHKVSQPGRYPSPATFAHGTASCPATNSFKTGSLSYFLEPDPRVTWSMFMFLDKTHYHRIVGLVISFFFYFRFAALGLFDTEASLYDHRGSVRVRVVRLRACGLAGLGLRGIDPHLY
ncbi:hypothetical protein CCM_07050 [Cordyceps militaris CM01]|uniref:Uncharacterized protein n=1 Tax=Cordyceps militaris (strain CM01) TaxID=983644 RepID=G3JLQ6_CORMM|nr:uncharacterized protein CCM_07050 [Cordyceps militaris CM01]EGX90630.1 hypothetical protein CCM_07050 [Cordyceps militaris CM01]